MLRHSPRLHRAARVAAGAFTAATISVGWQVSAGASTPTTGPTPPTTAASTTTSAPTPATTTAPMGCVATYCVFKQPGQTLLHVPAGVRLLRVSVIGTDGVQAIDKSTTSRAALKTTREPRNTEVDGNLALTPEQTSLEVVVGRPDAPGGSPSAIESVGPSGVRALIAAGGETRATLTPSTSTVPRGAAASTTVPTTTVPAAAAPTTTVPTTAAPTATAAPTTTGPATKTGRTTVPAGAATTTTAGDIVPPGGGIAATSKPPIVAVSWVPPGVPPSIVSAAKARLIAGTTQSLTVTAEAATPPTIVEQGALPKGTVWRENGNGTATLTGIPLVAGLYPLTITAAVPGGRLTRQRLDLTVIPRPGLGRPPSARITTPTTGIEATPTTTPVTSVPPTSTRANPVPTSLAPPTTTPPTTAPPTTAPPTTAPPTTTPPTTTPPTTAHPTTTPPTTARPKVAPVAPSRPAPSTTLAPKPAPPTTAAPAKPVPTTSAAPSTARPTTAPPTTARPNASAPTTSSPRTTAAPTSSTTKPAAAHRVAAEPSSKTKPAHRNAVITPVVTSSATATFATGTASSFAVTATGTPTPTVSEQGALPVGLTFHANGNGTATIAGTPTQPGDFSLTITAKNGRTVTQHLIVSVTQAPAVTSPTTATFNAGTVSSFVIIASGNPTPVISEQGALPAGLTFHANTNGTASIAGDATERGDYPITVTATNSFGAVYTQRLTVEVTQPPFMTSSPAATFTERMPGAFTIAAGGWPLPTLSVEGSLPPGLTFSDNANGTATLAGTPTRAGTYALNVTADNHAGMPTVQSVNVTVQLTPTTTKLSFRRTGGTATDPTMRLTAVVDPPVGIPTGTVTFFDRSGRLGSAPLNARGSASLTVSVPVGDHVLSASFGPSPGSGFAASRSAPSPYVVLAASDQSGASGWQASLRHFLEIGGALIVLGAATTGAATLIIRRRRPGRSA